MPPTILFVLTSHGRLGDTDRTTGWYLPEVAHPHAVLRDAGFTIHMASPAGGRPPMDPGGQPDAVSRAFLDDPVAQGLVDTTARLADVDPSAYDAVFFAGGHGTMWDFADDPDVRRIARHIHEAGGVVSAVCHGPAALVNVTLADGSHLVAGRRVAAFTDSEEEAVELTEVVPFLLESTLRERGAAVVTVPDFQANVVVSDRLVTGQNPASAQPLAERLVELVPSREVTR